MYRGYEPNAIMIEAYSWDKKKVCCKFYEDRLSHLEYGGYRLCR